MREFWVGLLMLMIFSAVGGAAGAGSDPRMVLGMNYDWQTLNMAALSTCSSTNRAVAARGRGFLTRYNDPEVRDAVIAALKALRHAGFTAIRSLVFFGPSGHIGPDAFSAQSPELAARNIGLLTADLRELGFSRFYLSFGPVGDMSLSCRRVAWGDCFNTALGREAVNFILKARAGIQAKDAGILYVDLQNEGGLTQYNPPLMRSNMKTYLDSLIATYSRAYPHDRTTVSIQDKFPSERLSFVLNLYKDVNKSPGYLEIHQYHTDSKSLTETSDALLLLDPQKIPVTIGETLYKSSEAVHLLTWLLRDQLTIPIIFWPLVNMNGSCGIDSPPPYNLNWLKQN